MKLKALTAVAVAVIMIMSVPMVALAGTVTGSVYETVDAAYVAIRLFY